jgi:hypothetical protein
MTSSKKANRTRAQKQSDHHSDQMNRNIGTEGTNKTNAKLHGQRGADLNPNRKR